jgi:hypothetical protein
LADGSAPPDEDEDEDEDEENAAADGEIYQRRAQADGDGGGVQSWSSQTGMRRFKAKWNNPNWNDSKNNMQRGFGNNTSYVEMRMVAREEECECPRNNINAVPL